MRYAISLLLTAVLWFSLGGAPVQAQAPACDSAYTVRPGDYLSEIATQCGVSYSDLLAANPQIEDPNLIFPGEVLTIPSGSSSGIPVTGGSLYIIQPGDTLTGIAERFGVSLSDLAAANPGLITTSLVFRGQHLTLPQGAQRVPTASITPAAGAIGARVTLAATGFRANQPVVVGFGRVGSTFYQLERLTTDANGALYKQVTIPDWPGITGQDGQYAFLVQREDGASIRAVSNPFYLTGTGNIGSGDIPVTGGSPFYVVQPGDTVSGIASHYGTTTAALLGVNPAIGSGAIIYPGQRLYLPVKTITTPSGPYIVIAPLAARPGNAIQVRAGNFPAGAHVDVRIARQGQPFSGVVDAQADGQGIVAASITVPASANPGEKWVVIVTTTDRPSGAQVTSQPIIIQ